MALGDTFLNVTLYTDRTIAGAYYERLGQLREYRNALTRLRIAAAKPAESVALITQRATGAVCTRRPHGKDEQHQGRAAGIMDELRRGGVSRVG